jgi:hypothetical protein
MTITLKLADDTGAEILNISRASQRARVDVAADLIDFALSHIQFTDSLWNEEQAASFDSEPYPNIY